MSDGKKLTRRAVVIGAGVGVGATALAAVLGRHGPPEAPKLGTRLTAHRLEGDLPVEDPLHPDWDRVEGILATMQAQQVAPPFLDEAGIDELEVRAAHDGEELVLRLAWRDEERDDLDGIARFHDAVAVQIPALPGEAPPAITMGAPGVPVHILQWRASWQRDLGEKTGSKTLYPNLVRDIGPEELLGYVAAAPFEAARAVGNPLSTAERVSPVEEIVAEGFGSATTLSVQRARGAGVWDEGRWAVTIAFPMARGPSGAPVEPGSSWPLAFAVWLGSQKNRGSRKHFADWVSCEVEA
jgi:hypothetical protein